MASSAFRPDSAMGAAMAGSTRLFPENASPAPPMAQSGTMASSRGQMPPAGPAPPDPMQAYIQQRLRGRGRRRPTPKPQQGPAGETPFGG